MGVIVLFAFTNLDIYVQAFFFDENTHQWILDGNNKVLKFIFYTGIKKVLIAFALLVALALVFLRKNTTVIAYKRGLIVVLFASICVPLVVGSLKAVTNMPCPKNTQYFYGKYPNVNIFEHYPKSFQKRCPHCKIKCWPAGHASGGFALLSLFFLFKSKRNKKRAVIVALIIGFSMGTYKMLIGDHFLSHTLITLLLAWLIILIIDQLITIIERKKSAKSTQI